MKAERIEDGWAIEVESEAETEILARRLAPILRPGTVIGLVGGLGAGKTRFTRALAEAVGVPSGDVSSPTFVLIHEYEGRLPIYHFDTYRLTTPEAFEDLGVSEYFEGGGICLVEWADRFADLLPAERWTLRFEILGPTSRRIEVRPPRSNLGELDALVLDRIAMENDGESPAHPEI